MQAYIAEELARLLIETYHSKHLPQMVDNFATAGFTKEKLSKDLKCIFLMIIVAAYDRRPFTGAAGGYEYIWGINNKQRSLPTRFTNIGLSEPSKIINTSSETIRDILAGEKIAEYSLLSHDNIDYSRTIYDAAITSEDLLDMVLKSKIPKDVVKIYNSLMSIHGIGETIASKLVKYLLREIAIGKIESGVFPLSVVWPITNEYHNEKSILKLKKLGSDVVPLTMGVLLHEQEPFAIDSLFYLNRHEPRIIDEFIEDIAQWKGYEGKTTVKPVIMNYAAANIEKAKVLLNIIKDVCNDIKGLTKKDLQGLAQPRQIEAAANKLYANMAEYASNGDINNMYRYYQNCLSSGASKWDLILERIGKKSLRSEWERFNKIYES